MSAQFAGRAISSDGGAHCCCARSAGEPSYGCFSRETHRSPKDYRPSLTLPVNDCRNAANAVFSSLGSLRGSDDEFF